MVRRTTNSVFTARIHWLQRARILRAAGADDTNVRRIGEFFPPRATNPREPALSRRALDAVIARVYIAGSVFQAQKHAF
jgi:hypothetical protein